MPAAYTLTSRPKDLSTTATLIHRLRHPLRVQRVRYTSPFPSYSSARRDTDERRPRIEDEWLEAPTRSGSPYRLSEIGDKGDYNKQRYDSAEVYWNSAMMEAGLEEKERRRLLEKHRRQRRGGRVFADSEQLYKTFARRWYRRDGMNSTSSATVPEPMSSSLDTLPSIPTLDGHTSDASTQSPYSNHNTNGDRHITLNEHTSAAELPVSAQPSLKKDLTWNSALTRILASPHVAPSLSTAIRTRDRSTSKKKDNSTEDVDMRLVRMVPNFSYPIASARWSERHDPESIPFKDTYNGGDVDNHDTLPTTQSQSPNDLGTSPNGISGDDKPLPLLPHSPSSSSSSSLYRPLTPPARVRPKPSSSSHSVLRELLDPEELELYEEIMSWNPRFTGLLGKAA